MSDVSMLQLSLQGGIKSRSMGVKLLVVCGLGLLMTIPALFVGGLVDDRTKLAADVIREISGHVGGQQTFLGPTLAIPTIFRPYLRVMLQSRACTWCFPRELRPSSRPSLKNGAVRSSRSRCSRQI